MKKTLIALTAAAGFAAAGLAIAPASATPVAPAPLGHAAKVVGNHAQQAHSRRHVRRDVRRHVRRHVVHPRRHFWAAGPWAFRGLAPYNCFRIAHGFVCYY